MTHGQSVDKDSKTEEATDKKIRDAVEKGQLPHSKEAAILASFVAILIFTVFLPGIVRSNSATPVKLPRKARRPAT